MGIAYCVQFPRLNLETRFHIGQNHKGLKLAKSGRFIVPLSSNLRKGQRVFPKGLTLRVNLTHPSNGQTLQEGGASLKCHF